MEKTGLVSGIVLIGLGLGLVIVAVFRALGSRWTHGWYEVWLMPVVGFILILAGRWLIG